MSIDPFTEKPLPFAQAARRLPPMRNGRPVSPATLWRWSSHGVRGIKLEVVKIGGTACTSLEALRRFFDRLSGEEAVPIVPSPTSARRADKAAEELERIGI